jgi:hypothetical protein
VQPSSSAYNTNSELLAAISVVSSRRISSLIERRAGLSSSTAVGVVDVDPRPVRSAQPGATVTGEPRAARMEPPPGLHGALSRECSPHRCRLRRTYMARAQLVAVACRTAVARSLSHGIPGSGAVARSTPRSFDVVGEPAGPEIRRVALFTDAIADTAEATRRHTEFGRNLKR